MKTKILTITIIAFMSLSLNAQMQTLTDTNVVFYDYIPDVVLTNPNIDSLVTDINQDGLMDLKFYITYISASNVAYIKTLNSNCKIAFFGPTTTDSLSSNSLNWVSGYQQWLYSIYSNRLGIKISFGTDNYYGWVDLISDGSTMTINRYAFCKIVNYPFLYGQTTISTGMPNIITPDSTNVYLGLGNIVMIESGKLIKTVSLTSSTGTVVATQNNLNSNTANVGTIGLAHGTYIVQVQFNDLSVYTKQIVL